MSCAKLPISEKLMTHNKFRKTILSHTNKGQT